MTFLLAFGSAFLFSVLLPFLLSFSVALAVALLIVALLITLRVVIAPPSQPLRDAIAVAIAIATSPHLEIRPRKTQQARVPCFVISATLCLLIRLPTRLRTRRVAGGARSLLGLGRWLYYLI
jgi:hypothetical protein